MLDIELSHRQASVIVGALDAIYQVNDLGFTEAQREIALELLEEIQSRIEECESLDFDNDNIEY